MARTSRMFEIIQILRAARAPMRAEDIAAMLEVSARTIYRDIAALQAMRTPIEGAAGVGYVMRRGYDLPPVNFDVEEAEAITVGLAMLARTGDRGLQAAATRVARKLADAVPAAPGLKSSDWGAEPPLIDLSMLRAAIRGQVLLRIGYRSLAEADSTRNISPLALIYYAEVTVLAAHCHLRGTFRHFRVDRIRECDAVGHFTDGAALRAAWDKERTRNWRA